MQCFEPEVKLITFTPDNWRAVFEFNRPHILIVESAWKGNKGSWKGKIGGNVNRNITELIEIIKWCRDKDIPTVFWNKEDPVHYDYFIDTAKCFDYVFTTCREAIDRYKYDLASEKVYTLPFAAQPKLHNPTELLSERLDRICFAGSYYRNKYEDRARDTRTLIEASLPYGIDIYDRNYDLGIENYRFPKDYKEHIVGVLKGKEIVKANKGYKVVLNLNTVKNSATMFARRVFELLASNTPVVSNYSVGINEMFKDIVVAEDDSHIIEEEIKRLMTDKPYYEKKRIKGLREVLLKHTYEERLFFICDKLDIDIKREKLKLLIIAKEEHKTGRKIIKETLAKQSFKDFELIFIEDNKCYDASGRLISRLQDFEFRNYDYLTYISSKDYYGENYLIDIALATKYSNADVIGKASIYESDNEKLVLNNEEVQYVLCNSINTNSMMIKTESIMDLNYSEIVDIFDDSTDINNKVLSRITKYSIDKYNYIKSYKGLYEEEVES